MASSESTRAFCSPCLEVERKNAATEYCLVCEVYMCARCVQCHNTFPLLKNHQVNNVDITQDETADDDGETRDKGCMTVPKTVCALHKGKPVDTYCQDHDKVCCETCGLIKHRSCITEPISMASVNFKEDPELNEVMELLNNDLIRFTSEKEKRKENADSIDEKKLELIESVDKYEEKIIERVKDMANNSRNEIREKCQEQKASLDKDVEAIEAMISSTEQHIETLKQAGGELLFTLTKTGKALRKDGETLLHALSGNFGKRDIRFHFNDVLNEHVLDRTVIGCLEIEFESKRYFAKFERQVNVKQDEDKEEVCVRDMCLLDSGDLLITDERNKKLKRFTSDFKFKDEIELSGQPSAVCKTDRTDEVAVRIWSLKVVHIVSVNHTMQLGRSFTLAKNGYGMTCDIETGEFYVCEGDQVSVYGKTGNIIRTYDEDDDGEIMFSECRQIALGRNKDIYITDANRGLLILDKHGDFKRRIPSSNFNITWPLCILPGDVCLTGSGISGLTVQIDKDGICVGNVIDNNGGLQQIWCAVYDHRNSRLIVAGKPALAIYAVSAK